MYGHHSLKNGQIMPNQPPRSTDAKDYQQLPNSLAVMPKQFADGHIIPPHSHPRDQLLYATTGIMRVHTGLNTWVVPHDRALFIPAEQTHEVEMRGNVQMETLYVSPNHSAAIKLLQVTKLLRELITALTHEPMNYMGNKRAELIAQLISIELDNAESLPLHIPLPQDERLQKLCLQFIMNPALSEPLEVLAENTGASAKTLRRLCQKELGMNFSNWRRRIRFSDALERLQQGELVKSTALHCGYNSTSAFSYAFRKEFGICPSEFHSTESCQNEE